jgi:sulfate/thiosulfate transport system ATP-binding protein
VNAIDPVRETAAPPVAATAGGLTLAGLSATHDNRSGALEGIDLAVAAGEFVALVGPSGAGKTTLLRAVAGLHAPSAGRIAIGGVDVTALSARARGIGFVFQNYALFEHMSVAGNVGFGLRVRPRATRPTRAATAARVAELLELVGIGALGRRRPRELSGGQRQRVALARALATEPRLLLLDEPFGALDPVVRKDIRTWLRGLHDRLGLTSLLVTHDQSEAFDIADRIVVLDRGRIFQAATPAELEDRPASDFVHRFLGERVAFDGTAEDGTIRLDDAPDRPLVRADAPSGPVRLSLRPYEIVIVPPTDGHSGIPACVLALRRAGPHQRVTLALPGTGRVVEALAPIAGTLKEGDGVLLDLSRARLFDNW